MLPGLCVVVVVVGSSSSCNIPWKLLRSREKRYVEYDISKYSFLKSLPGSVGCGRGAENQLDFRSSQQYTCTYCNSDLRHETAKILSYIVQKKSLKLIFNNVLFRS
jgi:hypothetical protein